MTTNVVAPVPVESPAKMPAGIGNSYAFQIFNTSSYVLAVGAPLFLYFKSLNASATLLGIAAALPPLLNILQMPASRFVEAIGYRTFVVRGWTLRSVFILGMSLVPLLPARIDAATRIGLMLFMLFAYNFSRGISVCGFLPWMTQLVPESIRGKYISRDAMCGSVAVVATLIGTSLYLHAQDSRYVFSGVFGASFVAAMISLVFLRRIPDVPPPPQSTSSAAVPWKEMALYPPFFRLMIYNMLIYCALAGSSVFWVLCLRDRFHLSDSQILLFGAIAQGIMTLSYLWIGRFVDRVGSRPVLALGNIMMIFHFACWCALSANFMPLEWWSVLLIQATAGIAMGGFYLANQRLVMATVPAMGRSHFLALFSVANGLTFGLLPIIWGVALDSLTDWHVDGTWWQWNNFSLLYAALVLFVLVAQLWHTRITEPRAMSTEAFFHELFVRTPSRALTRLMGRRPY